MAARAGLGPPSQSRDVDLACFNPGSRDRPPLPPHHHHPPSTPSQGHAYVHAHACSRAIHTHRQTVKARSDALCSPHACLHTHTCTSSCCFVFCFLHISVHPRAPTQRNRKHEQMQPYALAFTRHTNHDGSSGGEQLSFCDARRNLEKKIVLCSWFLVHFTQMHVQNECFALTINAKVDSCKNNCFSIKTGNHIHTLLFTRKLKVWQDFKIPD